MNFSLTEEQIMIRDSAQTFLAETCDSEAVRKVMASEDGFDAELWQSIAQELGWCALPVAEEAGGLGLGAVELMLVQEQAGYRLLSAPFFSTACLGASLLNRCADETVRAPWLAALAAGELRVSAPLPSTRDGWLRPGVVASQSGDAWVLNGELPRVPDAQSMQLLLLTAQTPDGIGLFAIPADAWDLQPLAGWDCGRRFSRVRLDGVVATRCNHADLNVGLERAASEVRLMIAAEQLGAAQRCLDITLDYVQERKQFGRIIGSFQAVKHRCAEMMVKVENTRSQVYGAAALAASAPDTSMLNMEVAAARSLATEALQFCSSEAIQLHGGVGFTWEYDPHLYFKRAQASAHWLGNPAEMHALIAAELLD